MKRLPTYGCLLFALSIGVVGSAWADSHKPDPSEEKASPSLLTAPIRLFQSYLSGADGHRCPMTPSCSSYAIQSIQRHGALKGWIMASDRLMRCGHDELRISPPIMTRHGMRCQDPVSNNDFWRP